MIDFARVFKHSNGGDVLISIEVDSDDAIYLTATVMIEDAVEEKMMLSARTEFDTYEEAQEQLQSADQASAEELADNLLASIQ